MAEDAPQGLQARPGDEADEGAHQSSLSGVDMRDDAYIPKLAPRI
jgi:hypothetical protein